MIARTETHTDRERILALLSPRSTDACVRQVFSDIDEINRLMEYYSFRTPQLADRFADLLEGRYRYEIFAIYGPSLLLRKSSDSSYLRLDQLLSSLIRVAVLRGHLFPHLFADRQRRRAAVSRPAKTNRGVKGLRWGQRPQPRQEPEVLGFPIT